MIKKQLIFTSLLIIFCRQILTFYYAPEQEVSHGILRERWLHSQYNLDKGYEFFGNISDEDLRTFAALELVSGKNPVEVNFEDPPLAKYLFGISYRLTSQIIFIQFIFSTLVLVLTYLLGLKLSKSRIAAISACLLLVFDRLFIERTQTVNLDMPQLFFIVLTIYLLIEVMGKKSKNLYLALGIAIGATIATKVIFVGLLLLVFSLFTLFIFSKPDKSNFSNLSITLCASISVYLLSYLRFFMTNTLADFVLLHLKLLRLYHSYLPNYPWFEIWRILIIGKWYTWFQEPPLQPVQYYTLAWPISSFVIVIFIFTNFKEFFLNKRAVLIFFWLAVYLLFQSTHVVFPRYLLIALPFLYLLATNFTYEKIKLSIKRWW